MTVHKPLSNIQMHNLVMSGPKCKTITLILPIKKILIIRQLAVFDGVLTRLLNSSLHEAQIQIMPFHVQFVQIKIMSVEILALVVRRRIQ